MNSYELTIITLNAVILLIAYLSVYPKIAGRDINKVAFCDLLASGLALMIVGSKYWGTGLIFNVSFMQLNMQTNWFWFTFISYAVLEIPLALWYFRSLLFKGRSL